MIWLILPAALLAAYNRLFTERTPAQSAALIPALAAPLALVILPYATTSLQAFGGALVLAVVLVILEAHVNEALT